MKDTLRTRIEFLWAKLAGRDVDIDTLTPDAPTNMVEKLMLETADRIGNAGGGGGGVFLVNVTPVEPGGADLVFDKTAAEINAAIESGCLVVIKIVIVQELDEGEGTGTLTSYDYIGEVEIIETDEGTQYNYTIPRFGANFHCDDLSKYPSTNTGGGTGEGTTY